MIDKEFWAEVKLFIADWKYRWTGELLKKKKYSFTFLFMCSLVFLKNKYLKRKREKYLYPGILGKIMSKDYDFFKTHKLKKKKKSK